MVCIIKDNTYRYFNTKSMLIKNSIRSTRVIVSRKSTFITSWIELTNVVLPIFMNKEFGFKCMKVPNVGSFDVSEFARCSLKKLV